MCIRDRGIAAIFGLSVFLHQEGVLSLAYLLGVLLFVFDLFGPLKALYGEATRPVSYTHLDVYKRQVYVEYRKAGYSKKYRIVHEAEILLHLSLIHI